MEENDLLCRVADSDGISRYFLTDKSEAYLLRHNLIEIIELLPLKYIENIYCELSIKFLDNNEFLNSEQETDKLFASSKKEVEEILKTVLKDVPDKEKQCIRKHKEPDLKSVVKK